ncbi:dihydropteroate synthase, partial [mine drainage metagenome]
ETLQSMVAFGIQIANDISGLEKSSMRAIVRENNLEAVVMHSRGTPATMQSLAHYDDLLAEVVEYFFDRLSLCVQDGIEPGKITLDPGLGFAKTWKDNLSILQNIRCLDLGFPILVGASRKSFIGHITGKKVEDRLPGTIATSLYLAHNGVDILRVHDARENRDAL